MGYEEREGGAPAVWQVRRTQGSHRQVLRRRNWRQTVWTRLGDWYGALPPASDKIMSKLQVKRRSKIKPFIKVANYNHMMPTRYSVDINFTKATFNKDALKEPPKRKIARHSARMLLEERYKTGKNKWFFKKLQF